MIGRSARFRYHFAIEYKGFLPLIGQYRSVAKSAVLKSTAIQINHLVGEVYSRSSRQRICGFNPFRLLDFITDRIVPVGVVKNTHDPNHHHHGYHATERPSRRFALRHRRTSLLIGHYLVLSLEMFVLLVL